MSIIKNTRKPTSVIYGSIGVITVYVSNVASPPAVKRFAPPHAAIRRQRKENKRRESGTLPRDLMGKGEYCYFCGEKVAVKGDKTCPKCHEREAEWAEEMRKRIDYKNLYWRKLDNAFWNERKAKFKPKEELSP